MKEWLPISSVSGYDEGWISPEVVIYVGCGPGQRIVEWIDGNGKRRTSQRKYGFDDAEFMRILGIRT